MCVCWGGGGGGEGGGGLGPEGSEQVSSCTGNAEMLSFISATKLSPQIELSMGHQTYLSISHQT